MRRPLLLLLSACGCGIAQSNTLCFDHPGLTCVLTSRYDNQRSGSNLNENKLTPKALKDGSFGKIFRYKVQGAVFAQPLVVSGLDISGAKDRNVLFIATMQNRVYAFDAEPNSGNSKGLFWELNLNQFAPRLPATPIPVSDVYCREAGYGMLPPLARSNQIN